MRRSVLLNAQNRKQLLVCCLLGIAVGVVLVAAGLALRHLLGHATPDWDLVVGLSFSLGLLLGLLLFLWRQLWQPLNELLIALPLLVRHRVRLELGHGIAPLLLLSHRINLLLETLNRRTEARQRRLDGIAHDIRGPLTRLQLRVEALQHGRGCDPDALAGLQADLNALLALDRDLDGIAIQPSDPPTHHQVNLEAFCRKLAKSYGPDRVQITMPPVCLRLDSHLLQRSLNNLIDNAMAYGSPPVVVSLETGADHIAINVDDHGPAPLPPGEGQGSPAPSRSPIPPIHRGLGLAIAEGFCRQHGGRLVLGRSRLGGLQVGLQLGKHTLVKQGLARSRR
jgi:two-component system, OmpR family, osmolarity sensor histidine kinase EnvZ|uniref:sensor histidine kinase n=1 Tax=Cyanobium sp. TaxID=2164130 RepID=UPI004047E102